jgi:glucan phosphoethanolaminetransferase (alkaline phosphatase superfamily)
MKGLFKFTNGMSGNLFWGIANIFLVLSHQLIFQCFKKIELNFYSVEKIFIGFCFYFLISFIQSKIFRYFFSTFILFLSLIQMIHLSYFGTQILPNEIWLLFMEWGEVAGSLGGESNHLFIPMIISLPFFALIYWLNNKLKMKSLSYVPLIFILYLSYNPIRTFITGNTWGRQPSTREFYGMNTYLSISYFLGRILPAKLSGDSSIDSKPNYGSFLKLTSSNERTHKRIIFILGESLTPHHMSLFDYPRETTPFLKSMMFADTFSFQKAISGGVSTDIAVAFLMNGTYGHSGIKIISKGERCLFRLAKKQGFSTSFFSSQSSEQLRYISPYICQESIDDFQPLEKLDDDIEDSNSASDDLLLPALSKMLESSDHQLIVLHMRGSHSPYNLRYSNEAKLFSGTNERVDDYDNSVVQFDLFMKKLYQKVLPHLKDTIVIYASDHGEGLGEEEVWGHGPLLYPSYTIPILIFEKNAKKFMQNYFPRNEIATHFNLSIVFYNLLGFKSSIPSNVMVPDYEVFGNDIDGFAGSKKVKAFRQ